MAKFTTPGRVCTLVIVSYLRYTHLISACIVVAHFKLMLVAGSAEDVEECHHVQGLLPIFKHEHTAGLRGRVRGEGPAGARVWGPAVLPTVLELMQNTVSMQQDILGQLNLVTWRSSTKIEVLVEELSMLRLHDVTMKSLVFSQFINLLDLIAYRLQRAGFKVTQCRFAAWRAR
ncbi:hypothetical protein B0H10DRAFT_1955914 [Mycena sp. CBHHK59/15]|nr:hypothetical protein B0H10DRAFT_1955914 [Mycena sp. CBHHK59/15]